VKLKRRVLLVEDDGDMRAALAEILEDAGYQVLQAVNGQDALEKLRSSDLPSVILLDLLMPVMNGWQFCEAWRSGQQATSAHVPIVAMSAAASKDPSSPYYIDVDDFIAKPIQPDVLLNKIETLISGTDIG